ncbi:MAG: nucleotidyltransferase family protein [Acidobacteria bacterium]|nr:nucleotidyltransferase family protein [Acidobacteriota bacterium]
MPADKIATVCRRWKVRELALFGSVLRDDFRPDSDVDVLVEFEPDDTWSLFDLMEMKDELAELFGRRVDLVERAAVEQSPNWIRRRHILENQRVIYAA